MGFLDNLMGMDDSAVDAFGRAQELYGDIDLPSTSLQELDLLGPQYQGNFQATQEGMVNADPSAMEGISTDPRLQEAQMNALTQLSEMGETGLLAGEQAALRQARRSAAGEAQAKSAQLMDEYTRRGMGGSGAELANRLQAAQSGADRAGQETDRLMQMAQERALSAIGQGANLAGSVRGQQFGEQSDIAKAKDSINQFNTQNQLSVAARNAAAVNQANMRNTSEQQRISEGQANTKNQQQMHNKELLQTKFKNQMDLANAKAGLIAKQGEAQAGQAAARGNMYGNIIKGGATIGAAALSDEREKKEVKAFDASKFLDSLEGFKYEYKDESNGAGKQVGVMAQDVEKEAPQLVHEDEMGTKYVDYNKAGGPLFASLADLHRRLSEIEKKKG